MIIEIDNREPPIIKEYFIQNYNLNSKLLNLYQGDFIIRDSNENILLIIERKSINDLLASVKDNRYSEQCERYSQLDINNSKIYYIIEGNINRYSKDSVEYKTIYSCIFNLSYKNEYSIFFTNDINGTINILEEFLKRLIENKSSSNNKTKLIKKQTITKDNIDYYMLNLVPGIGLNTAKQLLINYNNSFYEFVSCLKNVENEIDFQNIKINNRKLSKNIIENIKKYLL